MDSKKNFEVEKKLSVLDAFKAFFFVIIIMIAMSLILNFVLGQIASVQNVDIEVVQNSTLGVLLTYSLSALSFIIFFFVYNKCINVKNKFAISDGQKISLLPVSIAMVLAIICIFLFTPFVYLLEHLFNVPAADIPLKEEMSNSIGFFGLGVLVFALLPAIGEELIFRGIILRGLSSRFNGFVSIFITSLIFTLVHGSIDQTIYQFIVAVLLGYLAYVGGSLVYSIILHFLNNLLVILFGCFDIVGYLSERPFYFNIFSMIFPIMLFLLGLFLVAVLMWVLRYLRNKNFFRYVPKKKKSKKSEIIKEEPEKVGFGGFWKSLSFHEKVFMFGGIGIAFLIWLMGTITTLAG